MGMFSVSYQVTWNNRRRCWRARIIGCRWWRLRRRMSRLGISMRFLIELLMGWRSMLLWRTIIPRHLLMLLLITSPRSVLMSSSNRR